MKLQMLSLIVGGFVLIFTFQNCGEAVEFSADLPSSIEKGKGQPDPDMPPGGDVCTTTSQEDDCGLNDDPSNGHPDIENPNPKKDRGSYAKCLKAISDNVAYDNLPVDADANDKEFINFRGGRLKVEQANELFLDDISAMMVKVERAEYLTSATDVRAGYFSATARRIGEVRDLRSGVTKLNSQSIDLIEDTRALISVTAHEVGSINEHRGLLCLAAGHVDVIEDTKGALIALGSVSGPKSRIAKISDEIRGLAWLENTDIGTIEDFHGRLRVESGEVNEINDFRGVLILKNARVQRLQNARGLVVLINSEVDQVIDGSLEWIKK